MHKSSSEPTLNQLLESLSQKCQTKLLSCLKELAVESVTSEDYKSLDVLTGLLLSLSPGTNPTPTATTTEPKLKPIANPIIAGLDNVKFGTKSDLLELTDYIYNRVKADLDLDKFALDSTTSYEYNDHIYDEYLLKMGDADKERLLDLRLTPSRADRHLWKEAARAALLKLEDEGLAIKSGRFTYEFKPKKPAPLNVAPPLSFPKFPSKPVIYAPSGS